MSIQLQLGLNDSINRYDIVGPAELIRLVIPPIKVPTYSIHTAHVTVLFF